MAKALFNVLFKVIKKIINIFLLPVNALLVNFFPSFSQLISTFNSAVTQYIGGGLAYFSNLLPPYTKGFILLYLGILVSYYTVAVSVHLILKVIEIIKRVKIW